MKKTMAEIIIETIKFYGEDPEGRRGMSRGEDGDPIECRYMTDPEEGEGEVLKCAVGRVMTDKALEAVGHVSAGVIELTNAWYRHNMQVTKELGLQLTETQLREIGLDGMLKPEYRGHPIALWAKLQLLHDEDKNWDTSGLSPQGRDQARALVRKFDWYISPEEHSEIFAVIDSFKEEVVH